MYFLKGIICLHLPEGHLHESRHNNMLIPLWEHWCSLQQGGKTRTYFGVGISNQTEWVGKYQHICYPVSCITAVVSFFHIQVLFHRVLISFIVHNATLLCISLGCDKGSWSTRPLKKTSLFLQVTKYLIFEVLPDRFITTITSHHPLCQICTHLGGHNCLKGLQRRSQRTDLQCLKNVCS